MQVCGIHQGNSESESCMGCYDAITANAQAGQDEASGITQASVEMGKLTNLINEMPLRPDWDEYFIDIAKTVASRATCPRASVGAILVREHRVLATGYNGALPGQPHCIEEGCLTNEEGRFCRRVIHAEANVLYQAAKFGISTSGAIMYFWDSRDRDEPCPLCLPAITAAGIYQVINRRLEITGVNDGTANLSARY